MRDLLNRSLKLVICYLDHQNKTEVIFHDEPIEGFILLASLFCVHGEIVKVFVPVLRIEDLVCRELISVENLNPIQVVFIGIEAQLLTKLHGR